VLLNPGPATTTDAVKYAQVIPDICPRENEFVEVMDEVRKELVNVVHADPDKYTAVLFTGSGTIIQDVLVNSLVPEGKKICVVNNGAYSSRMAEIAGYYDIPCVALDFFVNHRIKSDFAESPMDRFPAFGQPIVTGLLTFLIVFFDGLLQGIDDLNRWGKMHLADPVKKIILHEKIAVI